MQSVTREEVTAKVVEGVQALRSDAVDALYSPKDLLTLRHLLIDSENAAIDQIVRHVEEAVERRA